MDDSAAAVDEAAMDPSMADAMMEDVPEMPAEEAPAAPSVVFCPTKCEAVMKIKRADDDSSTDPESDNVMSVVEYEVKLASSGVTSGGLKFGAAISIDEEGAGAATANGVNAASAYIGAADGTWTLSFGGVDPGIDLVGNIGLADADAISAKTIVIEPVKIGTLPLKLPTAGTDAEPVTYIAGELDATVKSTIKPITVSVDIDEYFEAVATPALTTDAASWHEISAPKGTVTAKRGTTVAPRTTVDGSADLTGTTAKDVSLPYTDPTSQVLSITNTNKAAAILAATEATPRTAIGLFGTVGSFTYRLTTSQPGDDAWSFGANYKVGGVTVGLGMDSNDVAAFGLKGEFGSSTVSGTYVKQSGEDYTGIMYGDTDPVTVYAGKRKVNEWTAMGLKFSQKLGSGTTVALAYSKKDDKNDVGDVPEDSNKIEFDFEYSLGGGATFFAGLDRLSEDMIRYTIENDELSDSKATKKTTTIEAGIKMKF